MADESPDLDPTAPVPDHRIVAKMIAARKTFEQEAERERAAKFLPNARTPLRIRLSPAAFELFQGWVAAVEDQQWAVALKADKKAKRATTRMSEIFASLPVISDPDLVGEQVQIDGN